jgi:LmbE family N-acetylglucosaminyl deacetylase
MQLNNPRAELFIPDGKGLPEALERTTALGVSAHHDDLEIMAYDGILRCFGLDDAWFTGVVVTDGRGSPRDDRYATHTDEQMRQIRRAEQKKAAYIGEYAAQFLLDYESSAVKDPNQDAVTEELKHILTITRPAVVYTHNLADKHETHVATALRVIRAIQELPGDARPEKVYGCEVWRDLDWLTDERKVTFDVSAHENLAAALMGVFDSQICGGKRYDLAVMGRRRANATFSATHGVDRATGLGYAMDLTPLIQDDRLDAGEYVVGHIQEFARNVGDTIKRFV